MTLSWMSSVSTTNFSSVLTWFTVRGLALDTGGPSRAKASAMPSRFFLKPKQPNCEANCFQKTLPPGVKWGYTITHRIEVEKYDSLLQRKISQAFDKHHLQKRLMAHILFTRVLVAFAAKQAATLSTTSLYTTAFLSTSSIFPLLNALMLIATIEAHSLITAALRFCKSSQETAISARLCRG